MGASRAKRLAWAIAVIVTALAGHTSLTEASCTGSNAWVIAPPIATGGTVRILWRVEPACDVIETGLLIGADLNALAPAGPPVYAHLELYQQDISVAETGTYWIVAYARDEEGSLIQSAPRTVLIVVPPPELIHGSHGGLTSFTGTDQDFLRPAGEPHFASLKETTRILRSRSGSSSSPSQFIIESRGIGSTDPNTVLSGQLQPLQVGPETLMFSAGHINNALAGLDVFFSRSGFPRSGLYIVVCDGSVLVLGGRVIFVSGGCRDVTGASLDFADHSEEQIRADGTTAFAFTSSAHSDAVFFIPSSPPGKRVGTARLRALVGARASPDIIPNGLRLDGKPPIAVENQRCFNSFFPGLVDCILTLTWDFTEEARSLSQQGGGELRVTPNPLPLASGESPNPGGGLTRFSSAAFSLDLALNYPWRHGGSDQALTITFEEQCPKVLDLVLTPDPFEPVQPRGLPARIARVATEVKVDASVKTCPPRPGNPPTSVAVTFMIDPDEPMPGTPDAGGHFHNGGRPRGNFTVPNPPKPITLEMCTVSNFDAQGVGRCDDPKTYFPSEVSGNVKIIAEALKFGRDEKKVQVQVPGLIPLEEVIIATFFRFTGRTNTHPDNHYGTQNSIDNTVGLAFDYFDLHKETLGINDMSLEKGGLFDTAGNWNSKPGHSRHRVGKSVDIDRCAQTLVKQRDLDRIAKDTYSGIRIVEKALTPLPCPGPVDTPRIHYSHGQ